MLDEILRTLTVDPEILEELSEDQKQVLFYKMREEQVKRWKVREEKLEEEDKKKPPKAPKPGKRNVTFKKGRDGCDWVWVMGDHPNDKSIEQILEEEAKTKAFKMAEAEAEALRLKEEAEVIRKTEEEKKRVIKQKEELEAEMRRKQEEAELYQSIKEARLALEKMELEKKKQEEEKKRRLLEIEEEEKKARRRSRENAISMKEKRSSEIYVSLQKRRHDLEKQAKESQKEVEASWLEQEKRSKEAEIKMRESARQARTEYRESLRKSLTLLQVAGAFALDNSSVSNNNPPIPPKRHKKLLHADTNKRPRPPKPLNHDMIVDWFQREERDRVGVLDTRTGNVVPWFHGIISRVDSEKILLEQKTGSFLVRVSERVWGYTMSFRAVDRCKHFLIDSSEVGYQFVGANQTIHDSLVSLVKFHKDNPITISGQEKLLYPSGQIVKPPDYQELFSSRKE